MTKRFLAIEIASVLALLLSSSSSVSAGTPCANVWSKAWKIQLTNTGERFMVRRQLGHARHYYRTKEKGYAIVYTPSTGECGTAKKK